MEEQPAAPIRPRAVTPRRRARRTVEPVALGTAVAMLVLAALFQFVIRPVTSPGFTYLAACLALGGIGALLAAGLKV